MRREETGGEKVKGREKKRRRTRREIKINEYKINMPCEYIPRWKVKGGKSWCVVNWRATDSPKVL